MNTVPYTNARRSGRTRPDLVEWIDKHDPRHPANRPVPRNRATRRARGIYRGVTLGSPAVRASRLIKAG